MYKAVIINDGYSEIRNEHIIHLVYGGGRLQKLATMVDLFPEIITSDSFEAHLDVLRGAEVIFSSWGFPALSDDQLTLMPNLEILLYAAGATRGFREPLLKKGIRISSATAANAIPVAEFALSHLLLAGAGFYRSSREYKKPKSSKTIDRYQGQGNYGNRIAILGNGTVSKQLQYFLGQHDIEVVEVASRLEERATTLEEAFSTCSAIVNLFPDVDHCAGIYNRALFASMMHSSVFINCGRGRQVNERDLISILKIRPDLTAILDVQFPEPPKTGSELYSLPNVRLSPHIAGSKGNELLRMGDYMIEEFKRFQCGKTLKYEVQADQL